MQQLNPSEISEIIKQRIVVAVLTLAVADAAGISVQVRAYDERVLLRGTLDGRSSLEFKRPGGDYFVRVEDGGEHSAEVDHADVQP